MAGLYLVRHGSTALNDAHRERIRGWLDVPLDAAGRLAARRAASFLADKGLKKLYTSDLARALQTAQVMSPALGLSVERDPALRPWNVGIMQGQLIDDVKSDLNRYTTTRADESPPGGESFREFFQRWQAALMQILNVARARDQNVGLVTHARNLYALRNLFHGESMPVQGSPMPGSVVLLDGDPAFSRIVYGT